MTEWFTSDTHINHLNVIQYCKRPFVLEDPTACVRCHGTGIWPGEDEGPCIHPDVKTMNEAIVRNWNERVQPDDLVRHLGDVFMGPKEQALPLLARLNGVKELYLGNHDRASKEFWRQLGWAPARRGVLVRHGLRILLEHNPHRMDLTDFDLGLCGHVHEHWRERPSPLTGKRVINVGVDARRFMPRTLEELLASGP